MVNEVSAVKFRQNLGEMINRVQYKNESILIKRDGKPVAALVDAVTYERIRQSRNRFKELAAEFAEGYKDVPMEEGLAEIDRLVEEVRGKKKYSIDSRL